MNLDKVALRSPSRIEHVAMWTRDLEGLAAFYARYFAAEVGPKYTNSAKGFESRFLSFGSGPRLELMRTTAVQLAEPAPGAQRMGLTHLAVSVGSRQRVDELTTALKADGFAVVDGPRQTGDGYYESVVLDPEGNRIEVTA
jgi:lactoylglutathione lyase